MSSETIRRSSRVTTAGVTASVFKVFQVCKPRYTLRDPEGKKLSIKLLPMALGKSSVLEKRPRYFSFEEGLKKVQP